MQVTVPRPHLLRLLERVIEAVSAESGAVLPLMTHMHVEARQGYLHVAAMSMDVAAKARVPATVIEPGRCAVSARRLYDSARMLLGTATEDTVTVRLDSDRLRIDGADGSARLPTLVDAESLLNPWSLAVSDTAATVSVDAMALREALKAVRHAVSKEESEAALCGVHLDIRPQGVTAVGTDRARMAVASIGGIADREVSIGLPLAAVAAAVAVLDGLVGPVQLDADADMALLEGDGAAVRATGISVPFPPYATILEKLHYGATVRVPIDRLVSLCRRAQAIAGTTASAQVTVAPHRLDVDAESVDGMTDGWVGTLASGPDHPPVLLPINPRFLAEAAEACAPYGTEVLVTVLHQGGAPMALNLNPATTPTRLRCLVVRKVA